MIDIPAGHEALPGLVLAARCGVSEGSLSARSICKLDLHAAAAAISRTWISIAREFETGASPCRA